MKIREKTSSERKKDHIDLAGRSQMPEWTNDKRFYYEPLLSSHVSEHSNRVNFMARPMDFPLWVSSMTGGTEKARFINENLATACRKFGLGMGLGSCRILLEEPKKHLSDFVLRHKLGPDLPFYANLGIAQLEKISARSDWQSVVNMLEILEADGLTIHVNPLQEWLQPEGDRFQNSPLQVINEVLTNLSCPVIVKEVGQGFGPASLRELMKLPVVIEFGAYGGTNFSQLELTRAGNGTENSFSDLSRIGHNAGEMIEYVNDILKNGEESRCKGFIISGGIKSFLDGYHAIESLNFPAIYGQASTLLTHALKSEKKLLKYLEGQIDGYNLAKRFLRIR